MRPKDTKTNRKKETIKNMKHEKKNYRKQNGLRNRPKATRNVSGGEELRVLQLVLFVDNRRSLRETTPRKYKQEKKKKI